MTKRQTREYWERHLEGWRESGLTQVAYCTSHGLHIKLFGRWRSKAREAAQAGSALLTLIPLSVAAPVVDKAIQLYSPGGWRIELPSGRGSWLADVLWQLP
jgi:hypothetical protein